MKISLRFLFTSRIPSPLARASGVFAALALAGSGYANTLIWNGGGADGNWNNSANWFGLGTPTNGDTLIFQGAARLNNTNNIVGLTVSQIQFRNGGFALRGNAFTLTNSLVSTNTSGANTNFCAVTLATADVTFIVSNAVTFHVVGNMSGTVGVVKNGSGSLKYSSSSNPYTGTTTVNDGSLLLNCANFNAAFGGTLVINNGATVQDVINQELPIGPSITVNSGGTLDLNNQDDTIANNLFLNGSGAVLNGNPLTLNTGTTVTAHPTALFLSPNITGKLFTGGVCTFDVNNAGLFVGSLQVPASITGVTTFTKTGIGLMTLSASNTFNGPFNVLGGTLNLANAYALGATNWGVTVSNAATLMLSGVSVTNESLLLASAGTSLINATGTNVWACTNITLASDTTVNADTSTALELQAPIGGSGALIKKGAGRLVYSGATPNTYTNLTSVEEGELDLAKNFNIKAIAPFGAGLSIGDGAGSDVVRYLNSQQIFSIVTPVKINSGALLDLNGFNDTVTPITMIESSITTGAGLLTVYNSMDIGAPLASFIFGNLQLGSPSVDFHSIYLNSALYIYATVSGASASLNKTGQGAMYLMSSNSYGGLTGVQQGWLFAENNRSLGGTNSGTVVSNGAALLLVTANITNESLTFTGPLGGVGGYGELRAQAGVNTWAGPITNNTDSAMITWDTSTQLRIAGNISGIGGINVSSQTPSGGTVLFDAGGVASYTGLTTVDAGGNLDLNRDIPGNLVINTNGHVRSITSGRLSTTADVLVNAGGKWDLAFNAVETINTLRGAGTVLIGTNGSSSWMELGMNNGSSTFDGVLTGIGYTGGGYTIAKRGSGTITLNGSNTFTNGYYSAAAGTLLVNGSSPQAGAFVANGATFGGSGIVGDITCNGTLAPGNGGPGILTCSNLTFSSTGTLAVDFTGPTVGVDYDQVNVRGTNTLANASLALNIFNFTNPVAIGQQFVFINNDAADAFTGIFSGKAEASFVSFANAYTMQLSYVGGTGNDAVYTLTAVPGSEIGAAITSGNGSHTIDPNECNSLSLVVSNQASYALNAVNATLSTTTPGVIITQPYSAYPNIPAFGKGTNITQFQISTLPAFVCGTNINLKLTVTSLGGDFITSFVLPSGSISATPQRYNNNTATSIPDLGTVDSTNTVTGFSGPLEKVAVSVYITHTQDSDLSLQLISPNGTNVLLVTNSAAGADFGTGNADANRTTFDDAAGTPITSGTAPFVGTFRPMGALTNFNFTTANGDWKLRIMDKFGGSLGTLRNWSLFLYPVACNDGGGNCDYCLASFSGMLTNTAPNQTGRINRNGIVASCGAPKPWPGTVGALNYFYDLYTFTNTTAADACVTMVLNSDTATHAVMYLNAFDPANISSNYVADSGSSGGYPQSSSASIPSGAKFIVVVHAVGSGVGSAPYTLQLSGLPCPVPTLAIGPAAATNSVRVHWPTWAGGYLLESNRSLTTPSWVTVTNEPLVNAGRFNVTNRMNPTNAFFRLKKP